MRILYTIYLYMYIFGFAGESWLTGACAMRYYMLHVSERTLPPQNTEDWNWTTFLGTETWTKLGGHFSWASENGELPTVCDTCWVKHLCYAGKSPSEVLTAESAVFFVCCCCCCCCCCSRCCSCCCCCCCSTLLKPQKEQILALGRVSTGIKPVLETAFPKGLIPHTQHIKGSKCED